MASLTITNTHVSGTKILAADVNTNNTDISGYINNRNAGTADWDFVSSAGLITAKANIRANDGSAATPSISFTSDIDTGLFLGAANSLRFSTGGSERLTITSAGNIQASTGNFQAIAGSTGSPSYTFAGDPDTGIANLGTNSMTLIAGAANHLTCNAGRVTINADELALPDGSEASPSITFTADADTGFYRQSSGLFRATCDGANAAAFSSTVTAGLTRLQVYDVDNGTLEPVSVGAADSGGAGFKVLRIPN